MIILDHHTGEKWSNPSSAYEGLDKEVSSASPAVPVYDYSVALDKTVSNWAHYGINQLYTLNTHSFLHTASSFVSAHEMELAVKI